MDGFDLLVRGEFEPFLQQLLPLMPTLESAGFVKAHSWIEGSVGFALAACGNPEGGLEWTSRALLGSQGQHEWVRIKNQANHACVLGMLDLADEALASLEEVAALAAQTGNIRAQAVTLSNLSYTCLRQSWAAGEEGDAQAATRFAHRALNYALGVPALDASEPMNYPRARIRIHTGLALVALGRGQEALGVLTFPAEAAPIRIPDEVDRLLGLAQALRLLGQLDEAELQLRRCRALAEQHVVELALPLIHLELIELAKAQGRMQEALQAAETRMRFLRRQYSTHLRTVARIAVLVADTERLRRETLVLREQSKVWEDAALHDALTGAFNRLGLAQQAQLLMAQGRALAVAAFDADHFKRVNDSFGHAVGDEVLKSLARIIDQHSREGDVLARVGGEEFLLLLPGLDGPSACATGERIRCAIDAYAWAQIEPSLRVTASIGVAVRAGESSLEALVARADRALYVAKQAGRNRLVFDDPASQAT